ncbi:MAG: hypothetical protein Q8R76_08715 [Candidatus Omnitrophota bacterium]|nr:hypothetical protein [Candidatus Omnitrophota bacterium]
MKTIKHNPANEVIAVVTAMSMIFTPVMTAFAADSTVILEPRGAVATVPVDADAAGAVVESAQKSLKAEPMAEFLGAAALSAAETPQAAKAAPANYGPSSRTTSEIRALPVGISRYPKETFITPGGAQATGGSQDRGVYFHFETGAPGWAGTGFTYDDFRTGAIETGDLTRLSEFTFGLQGTINQLKMEIVDENDQKSFVYLTGIRSDTERVWTVPRSAFQNVNMSRVRVIYFIVEGQNQTGNVTVNQYPRGSGYADIYQSEEHITRLPGRPRNNTVIPNGASASIEDTGRGIRMTYDTGAPGWVGGGFNYDDFGTGPIETANLSGYESLIFSLSGDPDRVKVEVIDDQNRKAVVYLHSITAERRDEWVISTADLAASGVNLARVRMIYFIVEGVHETGTIEINRIPTAIEPNLAAGIQELPGDPYPTTVSPSGIVANTQQIDLGIRFQFNTAAQGWAGTGWRYDQPADLTALPYLGFNFVGDVDRIKFEIVDADNKKGSVIFSGIKSDAPQPWAITKTPFQAYGVDLTRVRALYFIVEGKYLAGRLEVHRFDAPQIVVTPDQKWSLEVENEDLILRERATGAFRARLVNRRQEIPAVPVFRRTFLNNDFIVTTDLHNHDPVPNVSYLDVTVIKLGDVYADWMRSVQIRVPAGEAAAGYAFLPGSGSLAGNFATFTLVNGKRFELNLTTSAITVSEI